MPAPSSPRAPTPDSDGLPDGFDGPLARRALEASGTGLCIADARRPRFPLVWANDAFTASTGYPGSEIASGSCRILQWPEIDPSKLAEMLASLREGNVATITLQHRRHASHGSPSLVSFSPVRDAAGDLTHLIGVQASIAEEGPSRLAAWTIANHDPLTGLPNRTVLMDRIGQALARLSRRAGTVGLMFLDFDGFNHINDCFGHDSGDAFLRDVPIRLAGALRTEDTVARLGGDEFVVLCQDLGGEAGAAAVAERVLQAFEEPFVLGDEQLSVRLSVGIALAVGAEETPEGLLANADLAMYRAKQDGGDGFEISTAACASASAWRATCARRSAPTSSLCTTSRSWLRSAATSALTSSCPWPRRPGSSSSSADGCSTVPAPSSARRCAMPAIAG